MKKTALITTMIFTAMIMAGTVLAYDAASSQQDSRSQYGNKYHRGQGAGCGGFSNLTEEQVKQVSDLRQAFIDQTADLRIELAAREKETSILMATSEPDKARLVQLSREMYDLKKQMAEKRIDFMLEAGKIAPGIKTGFRQNSRGFNNNCPKTGTFRSQGSKRGFSGCPYN